jgi:DNA mismatch repair protein MutS2
VDEALDALTRYLDDAGLAGLNKVLIIRDGRAPSVMRSRRGLGHPLVRSLRPGERGEGGDGATIVEL